MQTTLKGAALALAVMFMVGCGGSSSAPQATGGMKLSITADTREVLNQVTLNVSGPKGYTEKKTGAIPLEFIETPCPVGDYTYEATGAIGNAVFSAKGAFTITAGDVTVMHILMQQVNAVPMTVIAPYTSSVEFVLPGGDSGAWGQALPITANVTHPDNDRPDMDWFVYEWKHECKGTESGGKGFFFLPGDIDFFIDGFSRPTAKVSTKFTSFCQGTEVITLVSTNTNNLLCPEKGCQLTSTVSFEIKFDPQGFGGDIKANFAPVVSCDSVMNAEPCPGGVVLVTALASDPDGDALTYKWTDTCGGSFDKDNILNPQWTAPSKNEQECVLLLTVTDARDGVNTGSVRVKTAPAAFCPAVVPN